MEIARWERKLAYEKYKEDGKTRGFWGSQYGDFIARYFPAKVYVSIRAPSSRNLHNSTIIRTLALCSASSSLRDFMLGDWI